MNEEFKKFLILSIIRNKVSYEFILSQCEFFNCYKEWSDIQTSVISGIDYWDDEQVHDLFRLLEYPKLAEVEKFFAEEEGFISQ